MTVRPIIKWSVRILLIIPLSVAIVFFAASCLRWYAERPVVGAITFSDQAASNHVFDVGMFVIRWNPRDKDLLTVNHREEPDKALWACSGRRAFLGAAEGREKVLEKRGMFTVSEDRITLLNEQYVKTIQREGDAVVIRGSLSDANGTNAVDYVFTLREADTRQLSFHFASDARQVNRLLLTGASTREEGIFGFGEQFTCFNMKGKRLPIFVSEQGIGRGKQPLTFLVDCVAGAGGKWHTSYAPVPHYITSAMRSLFLETHAYSVFDMRDDAFIQITVFDRIMDGRILAGNTPAQLIGEYTAATGRMRPLPDWILDGAVVGLQGGTEKVRQVWEMLQQQDTPIAAFWLQDWVGQRKTIVGKQLWWNWELDRDHYPGWEALLDNLAEDDIRVMTYVNPFLIDPTAKEKHERNLFQEALDAGYLIQHQDNTPYLVKNTDFSAAMVDLTNPEAYGWMKEILHKQVIGKGVSGWMADFGEALPYDARMYSGESAATYHNRYPEAWAKLNREVIEETGNGDEFVFFMRSGYRESPRYATLFWQGDQMTTWDEYDGIKSAVTGLLSSGMSGYAFNHSDIGGYTAIASPLFTLARTKELLMRWMELNAFTVVFRTHEGINPDANHQFYSDEETLTHFSRCAKLYNAWKEYRKTLVRESSQTGLPVVRHPFIHYPDNLRMQNMTCEQFMVGEVFMIVPVLDPDVSEIACYLPRGKWTHLWPQQQYDVSTEGMDITVSAPMGKPAVFYRSDAPEARVFVDNLSRDGLLQ